MIAGFIATGLAEVELGQAVRYADGPRRSSRIASAMIIIAGLGFLTAGIFNTDPGGQVHNIHGALHFAAAVVLFFASIPAAALAMAC